MTRSRHTHDFWSAAVMGLLGSVLVWGAMWMPMGTIAEPGDGFMPLLVGAAMVLFSAALAFKQRKHPRSPAAAQAVWPGGSAGRRLAVVLGAMTAYVVSIEWMGFPIATFILLVFLMRAIDPRPWKTALWMGFVVTGFCFLLFQVCLKVHLPSGWLSGVRIGPWIF